MKRILFFITIFVISISIIPNVYAEENEAKVGDDITSFEDAINKVKDIGGTIELQQDVTLSSVLSISVENPITINLNTHKITSSQDITLIARKGEIKITGEGVIENTKHGNKYGTIYVKGSNNETDINYTHLTIDKNVSVKGPNPLVIDAYDQSNNHCYGAVVDIYGKLMNNLSGYANPTVISVSSKLKDITNAPIINIHDGANIKNDITTGGVGILLFGYANVNADKATIEAHTGIYATSGSINLEDTTIKATGQTDYKEQYGKGTGATGAAIQIESNSASAGNIEFNINGGNYSSEINSAIVEYSNGATETSVKEIHIYDGNFTSAEGKDTINVSESFEATNTEFIMGGKFLSGNNKFDVSQYMSEKFLQKDDGTVVNLPVPQNPPKQSIEDDNILNSENQSNDTVENNNIENPNTSDINLYLFISLILFGICGFVVTINKTKFE